MCGTPCSVRRTTTRSAAVALRAAGGGAAMPRTTAAHDTKKIRRARATGTGSAMARVHDATLQSERQRRARPAASRATRFPDKETVEDDSHGVPLALMQGVAHTYEQYAPSSLL